MLNVTIKINCENAAFAEDCEGEVARLLREAADKIERYRHAQFHLRDANGNVVGEVTAEMEA